MNIFGFRPFKGKFNLGNSDDIPTNPDGTLIGALKRKIGTESGTVGEYTTKTIEKISYDDTHKKLILKVNGADTPVPFSSGAKLVGTYAANTTVDVSAYGATNINQFLLVPYQTASGSGWNSAYSDASTINNNLSVTFTIGSLSLSGNTLSITLPVASSYSLNSNSGGYFLNTSASKSLPCKLYFVGDIS